MNSEGFRETFLRSDREGPKRPRWREGKKTSIRQAHVVKQRSIEKKLKVPQGQRMAPRGEGEERPRRRGNDRNRSRRWKPRRERHHVCRSVACFLAHGVDMPYDGVHRVLPCPSGVQLLPIPLSGGEDKKSEETETAASRSGIPHVPGAAPSGKGMTVSAQYGNAGEATTICCMMTESGGALLPRMQSKKKRRPAIVEYRSETPCS